MRPVLCLPLLVACSAPIDRTFVDGPIAGVTFKSPTAISAPDSSSLGDTTMVLISDVSDACSHTRMPMLFMPSGVVGPDGGFAPALILRGSNEAFLDRGGGLPRLTAGAAKVNTVEQTSTGTLKGHFDVIIGTERVTGDYVAPRCSTLFTGCSAAGAGFGLPLLGALLLRGRRR